MNPDPSKLRQQQQQAEEATEQQVQQEGRVDRQFDSPEEMIRFDTAQTVPPESIAERLKESIAREPTPPKSWWQRLFRRQ
jgi:hypothetical protein